MDWDSALKLAKGLAEEEIPFISKEYAVQLEFKWVTPHTHPPTDTLSLTCGVLVDWIIATL